MKNFFLTILAFITNFSMKNFFDKIHNEVATGLSHYEQFDESLEDLEDLEDLETEFFEHLNRYKSKGQSASIAKKNASNMMTAKYGKRKMSAVSRKVVSRAGTSSDLVRNTSPEDGIADFTIIVTRNSNNIAAPLPFLLFGVNYVENQYRELLTPFLTNAVILTSVVYNNAGNMVFTYTLGVNVDTVTVSCNEAPYSVFLQSTRTDLIRIQKVRYNIADTTKLANYSQPMAIVQKSLFGTLVNNKISVTKYKNPQQFQNGIVDVMASFDVDKTKGLVHYIIENNATLELNHFVSDYKCYNAGTTKF
jgi:hypothetical protein